MFSPLWTLVELLSKMNTLSHEHMLPTEKWSEWYRKQEITQSLCSVNGDNGIHCTSDIACKPQNVTMDLKVMLCVLHTVYTLFVSPPYIEIGLCCIPITLLFFFIPTACSKDTLHIQYHTLLYLSTTSCYFTHFLNNWLFFTIIYIFFNFILYFKWNQNQYV